jgi:hypothetical protein
MLMHKCDQSIMCRYPIQALAPCQSDLSSIKKGRGKTDDQVCSLGQCKCCASSFSLKIIQFSFSLELINHKAWRRGLVCKGNLLSEILTFSLGQALLNHQLQHQQHIVFS